MRNLLTAAALAGLLSAGTCTVALAQAEQGSQTSSEDNSATNKNETMKQCLDRQKATNSGLTSMQVQTTCKNEMKANKTRNQGNDLATGPQAGDKPPQQ